MAFVLLSLACVIINLGVFIYSLYNNKLQKSAFFNLLNLAIFIALLGNFVEVACRGRQGSLVGVRVAYLGMPFIPVLWYLCIREFCGIAVKRASAVMAIMAVPAFITVLAFTWEYNHLLFREAHYLTQGQYGEIRFDAGPLYFLKPLYLYLFSILGVATIITGYVRGTRRFRQQAVYFLVSALIPLFNTSNYLVETDQSWFDITPYGLALSSVLFLIAHSRYGLKNYSDVIRSGVVEILQEGIVIFDNDGIYLYSNQTANDIFPELTNVRIGTSLAEMGYLPFDASIFEGEPVYLEYTREQGDIPRTYRIAISAVCREGGILGRCVILHNITPLKHVMNELENKAYTDALTGAFNRGYFFERANYASYEARLTGVPLCLVMFDLDHFKKVNDTYGHAAGDYVLRTVVVLVQGMVRKADILGRYGGEEFCLLMPGTDVEEAAARAEALRRAVAEHDFAFEGKKIPVTSSFGVAALDPSIMEKGGEEMVKRADGLLYQAKNGGRNRVVAEKLDMKCRNPTRVAAVAR